MILVNKNVKNDCFFSDRLTQFEVFPDFRPSEAFLVPLMNN